MGEVIGFPRRDARPAASSPARPAGRPRSGQQPRREVGEPEPLWREVVGHALRRARHDAGRTLADVAAQAGVSTQYLSEIERGRKEPSSEVLGAVGAALGLRLVDLTSAVSRQLAAPSSPTPTGPVCLAV